MKILKKLSGSLTLIKSDDGLLRKQYLVLYLTKTIIKKFIVDIGSNMLIKNLRSFK